MTAPTIPLARTDKPRVQYTGSNGESVIGRLIAVTDFTILLAVPDAEPVPCWTGGKFSLLTAT